MASENILSISLKEYKAQIDELKSSLLGLEKGSEEYASTVGQIEQMQRKLNDAMNAGKGYTTSAEGSYNQLVQTMKELKEQWRATADVTQRAEIGKKILEINNQLKELDASVGNYQRNVGNYANAFKEGFSAVGGSLGTLVGQAQSAGKALIKAFSANPYITAICVAITAVVAICAKLKEAVNSDEEAQNKLSEAMANFEPIILIIKEGISTLADAFVTVVEWVGKAVGAFTNFLGITDKYNNSVEKSVKLKKDENALEKDRRNLQVKNSELQLAMSAREEEIARARKTNSKEYHRLLNEQKKDQEAINKNNVDIARRELELAKARAQMSRNSKADNEALAKAQIAYNNALKEANSSMASLTKQDLKVSEGTKSTTSTVDKAKEAREKLNKSLENSVTLLNAEYKQSMENYKFELELAKAEGNLSKQEIYEKENNALAQQASYLEQMAEKYRSYALQFKEGTEERKKWLDKSDESILQSNALANQVIVRNAQHTTEQLKEEYKKRTDAIKESNKSEQDELHRQHKVDMALLDEADNVTKIQAEIDYQEQRHNLIQEGYQREIEERETYLATLKEGSEEFNTVQLDLDRIKRESAKETADYEIEQILRVQDKDKESQEETKKNNENKKKSYKKLATSISSLMGTINDAINQHIQAQVDAGKMSEEEAEKEFNRTKALQYSVASINTIAGAVGGFMGAMNDNTIFPTYLRPILGAIYASTATAEGIAQMMAIKNATFGSGAGASSSIQQASVAPLLNETLDSQQLTSLNTEQIAENTGGDTRVYIQQSDLEKSSKQVEVRQSNTTF